MLSEGFDFEVDGVGWAVEEACGVGVLRGYGSYNEVDFFAEGLVEGGLSGLDFFWGYGCGCSDGCCEGDSFVGLASFDFDEFETLVLL